MAQLKCNGVGSEVADTFGFRKVPEFKIKDCEYKDNIFNVLQTLDRQQFLNRYVWYNLPDGLNSELVERMLYYRGQLAFAYDSQTETFYLLPYALSGRIDPYGRYTKIKMLPFTGVLEGKEEDKNEEHPTFLDDMQKEVVYDFPLEIDENLLFDSCVLLYDYSNGYSQEIIPRYLLSTPLIEKEAEALPFARTALIAGSGVQTVQVEGEDAGESIIRASEKIGKAALNGLTLIPTIAGLDPKSINQIGKLKDTQEYLLYMQALDNFRLQTYGVGEGVFEKKEHMLTSEYNSNQSNTELIFQDGLRNRQEFCNMVNQIWGLNIWCEPSETIVGDTDMDGKQTDEVDQSGQSGNNIPNEMGGNEEDEQ